MSNDPKAEPMLFTQWMAEQFDCGLPDVSMVSQSLAYIEGLKAGDPERFIYLSMVAAHLRQFEIALRQLKQMNVRMPYG